mmetsp:Transcript_19793/g.56649  ORF Transcript_19793/g.56649 Transcript_19793/m.56649 type:complete len:134 (-) Transcript_19793:418-819(-)
MWPSARCRTPSPVLVYTAETRSQMLVPYLMLEESADKYLGPRAVEDGAAEVGVAPPRTHLSRGGKGACGSSEEACNRARDPQGGRPSGETLPEPATEGQPRRQIRLGKLYPSARRRLMKRILKQEAEEFARRG